MSSSQSAETALVLSSPGIRRLGRVSFKQVLKTLDYLVNETETSPVTEALLQLRNIYHLLDKRQEQQLVSRMKVLSAHKLTGCYDSTCLILFLL